MSALSLDERLASYLGSIYRALSDEADRLDPARDRSQNVELVGHLMNMVGNASHAYILLTGRHPNADGFRQMFRDADGNPIKLVTKKGHRQHARGKDHRLQGTRRRDRRTAQRG